MQQESAARQWPLQLPLPARAGAWLLWLHLHASLMACTGKQLLWKASRGMRALVAFYLGV